MPLTLEEQERLAYISGDTRTAVLLALTIDESAKAADAYGAGWVDAKDDND